MAAKRRKIHCFWGEIRFTVTFRFGEAGGEEEEKEKREREREMKEGRE